LKQKIEQKKAIVGDLDPKKQKSQILSEYLQTFLQLQFLSINKKIWFLKTGRNRCIKGAEAII
jgi:hypothetical protein